jgi:hypothetical protein
VRIHRTDEPGRGIFPGPARAIYRAIGAGLCGRLAPVHTPAACSAAGHVRATADIDRWIALFAVLDARNRLLWAWAVDEDAAAGIETSATAPDRLTGRRHAARRALDRTAAAVIDRAAIGVETDILRRAAGAAIEGVSASVVRMLTATEGGTSARSAVLSRLSNGVSKIIRAELVVGSALSGVAATHCATFRRSEVRAVAVAIAKTVSLARLASQGSSHGPAALRIWIDWIREAWRHVAEEILAQEQADSVLANSATAQTWAEVWNVRAVCSRNWRASWCADATDAELPGRTNNAARSAVYVCVDRRADATVAGRAVSAIVTWVRVIRDDQAGAEAIAGPADAAVESSLLRRVCALAGAGAIAG